MILQHAPLGGAQDLSRTCLPGAATLKAGARTAVMGATAAAQLYAREHLAPALSANPAAGRHRHVLQDPSEAFLRAVVLVIRDAGYSVKEEHGVGPESGPYLVALTLTWDVE